jgi:hypothetical protein
LNLLASFFGDAEIPLEGNIEALALQIVRFSHARTGSDPSALGAEIRGVTRAVSIFLLKGTILDSPQPETGEYPSR